MSLRVGDAAPDFTLEGTDGAGGEQKTYRLADGYGHPQVLVFYPADETPVCTEQLKTYTAGIGELQDLDARVLALSPQSVTSHQSFAAAHGGFAFPLLSDPDKAVGRAYGIIGLLDLYRRTIVVIDPAGAVTYLHRAIGPGLNFVPLDAIVAAIPPRSGPSPSGSHSLA
jgi:peroxiredoxin Q/BCP